MELYRKFNFNNKILVIDGQPGCGKTLFSKICSSFERVEILNYAFEIEFVSKLYKFNKITEDAAITLAKMFADHKIYQSMMGRETNFRYNDLSSVFNYPHPIKYFKRIFSKGDKSIPNKILLDKPILNLTCHDIFYYSDILFKAFDKRLIFFEIIRHPLYMVIQQHINERELINNPRDIQLKFNYLNYEIPYYADSCKGDYIKLNSIDKTILAIYEITKKNDFHRKNFRYEKNNLLTIPFEKFVINPEVFLSNMCNLLGTKFSNKTKKILKQNNIPRTRIEDGIDLKVYRRYGWKKSIKNSSFEKEKNIRLKYLKDNNVSDKYYKIILELSEIYENKYAWF